MLEYPRKRKNLTRVLRTLVQVAALFGSIVKEIEGTARPNPYFVHSLSLQESSPDLSVTALPRRPLKGGDQNDRLNCYNRN